MAATNPFKSHDLLHKYGWDIIPYLSNLGVRNLAEAQLLFVDSGSANKSDADDTEHGHSFEKPLATVDYAIGLCTASEGAIILVAPGHVEDYDDTTTGFNADVAGIAIIGLGVGSLRPRFDFNHATSKCLLGANDVQLKNVVLRPGITTVAVGLEIASGFTGCVLEDVELAIGETAATDEFVKALHLVSGNHDTVLKNVKILADAAAAHSTHALHIAAASDRLTFKNVIINGKFSTGGIVEAAAGEDHIFEDCSVDVVDGTNLSFNSSSTFAKRTRNLDGGAAEDTAENLIGKNDADNAADTSSVAANADGSVLERLEIIQTYTDMISGATLPVGGPTANSLARFIASGGGGLGQQLPVSMSLVDLIGNYTGSHDELLADDNIKAHLDLIKTDIGTAQTDLDTLTGASGAILLTATQASIDAIETDTETTIPGLIGTAQADLDIITGASGVNLLTATQASIDAIEIDTETTIPGLIGTAQADLDILTGASGVNLLTATQASVDAIEVDVVVGEATGEADIDISEFDYTGYVNIMTVTAPPTGLANCRIDLDFNKATTGWDTISTAADTLDAVAVVQVDGTNYCSTQKASAQITANGNGTLDASESGKSFDIGPMGPNGSVQIHVKLSVEVADVVIPYRVSYVGAAPTITPIVAA